MTEERAPYATDEVTQLRRQVAQLVDRLDAAFKTIGGFTDASNFQWAEYQRRIKELEATVQRLEQDNKRLRHMDSMPVNAMDRIMYDVSGDLLEEWTQVRNWLNSLDGAA